ncbi:MAG: HAMP domain-containing histidine kinase [Planctomycetes bacterium]|nr:HAMP domain-containing histidine kinase [Planctomycetota bacterium]MCB9868991.1 HAMP domain-containing histidine kinase [Planctomycetota bacterium]MCB9887951.1 HAMP domain-containing histidine kinase [Planctomycetota bacterium]
MTHAWPSAGGHLAEVIGHEIRNPLASAVANLGVLAEMIDERDPRAPFAARAMSDLARASSLLTSYLDLERSGHAEREVLAIDTVVRRACERHATGSVRVEHRDGAPGAMVHGNSHLLERLLENLLENAIGVGARRIEVVTGQHGGTCTIEVQDDGPGIPPQLHDKVFEPFVSGRSSSGLGLALVRRIVELHDGSIALVPSTRGALFHIELPVSWS